LPVSLGLGLITGQVPPGSARTFADEYRDLLELSRLGDAAGFGSLWVSEHHGAADGYLPSLNVMLGAMAAVTMRIELGMGVSLAPFHHPLRFAEDCAVVDQISGGRLLVGLGLGWREEEFRAFGIGVGERVARTRDLVEVCRRAWAPGRFSYGPYTDVAVTPRPAHPVPILMGGTVEASVRRAGRLGDGFLSSQWAGTPDLFLERVAVFDEAVRAAGRDPADMILGAFLNAWVAEDGRLPEGVVTGIHHQMGTYAAWAVPTDVPGTPYALPPLDREAVASRVVAGSPDQVAEGLRPWVEALRDRRFVLSVRLHYPGMPLAPAAAAIELFAAKVAPQLA
jgi:alkanesulfonate monooxygenase SsuD/methylene tetrahydromethanopterin reductase-like flavin-dependent oxidoreductase (luciferase family)